MAPRFELGARVHATAMRTVSDVATSLDPEGAVAVEEFVREEVDPVLARYADLVGVEGEVRG